MDELERLYQQRRELNDKIQMIERGQEIYDQLALGDEVYLRAYVRNKSTGDLSVQIVVPFLTVNCDSEYEAVHYLWIDAGHLIRP